MSIYDQTDSTMPADYAASLETVAPGIGQIVTDQTQGDENWFDALARALPIIATTAQQAQILKVQTDRARQGLPPLNASQYGVGVTAGLSEDTKQILLYAAIGIGVMFALHHTKRGG